MKKVLCLIDSLGSGGAERQMAGLVVLLKRRGYDVTLATYHVEDFYGKTARNGGVPPVVLYTKNNSLSKLLVVKNFVEQGGYECLITYKSGPNAIGCILKLLGMKCKLIVSERSFSMTLRRRDKICFFLYRYADYVVPNSYTQTNFIKNRYSYLANKVVTITNFTDTGLFSPLKTEQTNAVRILTVARIAKMKNVLNYLEAIAKIKNGVTKTIHFDWYGDVHQSAVDYNNLILKRISELEIGDVVEFHPATSQIVDEYRKCDIFCLPSFYEGFPNVICEAMSCGKPVVCSNVCDNPQIVQSGKNGLHFNPYDVNDIFDKLKQIIEMPEQALLKWGEKSRDIAISLFSEDSFIDKYINLIETK